MHSDVLFHAVWVERYGFPLAIDHLPLYYNYACSA